MKNYNYFLSNFVFLFFFIFNLSAQNHIDSRISDAYGQQYANELSDNNLNRLNYLNYFLDHSYEFKTIKYDSNEKFPKISEFIKVQKNKDIKPYKFDLNHFNVLMYSLERDRKLRKTYRVDDSDLVIIFYSEDEFIMKMNEYYK